VAIVFILFSALARDQPTWITEAKSYPILKQTQVAIESLMPMNPEQYLPGGSTTSPAPEASLRRPALSPAHPPMQRLPHHRRISARKRQIHSNRLRRRVLKRQ
jgi:membrane protein required for colicin V production